MVERCVICKKCINIEDNKYEIDTTIMKTQQVSIQSFLLETVFELNDMKHEHLLDDTYSCQFCYDLLLEFEDYISKCKIIQNLIVNTYLEATEIVPKSKLSETIEDKTCEISQDCSANATTSLVCNNLHASQDILQNNTIENITNTELKLKKGNENVGTFTTKTQEVIEFGLLPRSIKGPFCCEVCGKTYQGRQAFKLHLRLHKNQNLFECPMCDKKYTQRMGLERHQVIHTGTKSYKCEICDKTFYYASSIQAHYQVHSGKREFSCAVCDKTFAFKQHLKRHMKTHNGEKKLECTVCKAKFLENYNLVTHMKKHKN